MLWIIPLIATASLVTARPKPYRTVSTYTAFYGKGSQYDNVAGISEPESTVVTFLSTKFITSTWYIPGPATANPISTPESGEQSNTTTAATPAGNQQVIYVTVPVTVPAIQTVTTIADEAIETVFETVTSSIPAETHFVVVMLITSIKTRISVTTTQSMMEAAAPLSKLLPGSGPGWKREILEAGTKTLAPFTSVPPVPGPAPLTACISEYPQHILLLNRPHPHIRRLSK
ncbi:hypothetical protein BGW36DRAFT_65843 [Talaromyces proteolyticus]|uniref:Uncharacterized protein n=1 Tax=Talaromyces proteolyticus TaxID=1131652 RepID=A0AAD4PUY4_9EURO|nr:uncharacterized protein BGW36DRAFT_65843 [Talaromyces proteolyticus]KAH8689981.1 hypothetical protein BGW36DRAFT_65843 [Talaromyces proteolyticus]